MNKIERLSAFVAERIATHPYHLDGFIWGQMPRQEDMASMIGMSAATIRRIIAEPPFVRRAKKIDGKKTLLLREGEPGPITVNHIANIMSNYWRGVIAAHKVVWQEERQSVLAVLDMSPETWAAKKEAIIATLKTMPPGLYKDRVKRLKRLDKLLSRPNSTTKREYGCMIGLAGVWPDGHQVDLFKMVAKRWPVFMVGVKWAEFMKADDADPEEQAFKLHLEFPSLSVIRLHPEIALEMATMDAQETGKVPLWLKAFNPAIWPKAKSPKVA